MAHQTSEIIEKQATPRFIGRLMDVDLFPISGSASIELEDDLSTHINPTSSLPIAIEDFHPLHVKHTIENRRHNRVRHLNSPLPPELRLREGQPIPESSRMNADDRLSLDPLGPVEGGNRIVEGSHVADVCPQPTKPDPLDELIQLGVIGYNDKSQ
jgi:hypothetical protein